MNPVTCHLLAWSDDARLQQIYTGLTSLSRQGLIHLRQSIVSNPISIGLPQLQSGSAHTLIILNDSIKVLFDLTDHGSINPESIANIDHCFKRSYDPSALVSLGPLSSRIHPLGLNYPVFPNRPDIHAIRRACAFGSLRQRLQQLLRLSDPANLWSSLPRERHLSAPPNLNQKPNVLFLARAWDPQDSTHITPQQTRHYNTINETRAACIRALRTAFGDAFTGGFSHTPFAQRHFPDALASHPNQTSKRAYLQRLKEHPICVTSEGLHHSIGWKMGEYVALSKAIVSEKLAFTVPGPFADGTHYLSYQDPDGCVAAVKKLIQDVPLRHSMMTQNHAYFLQHLQPDRLVAHSLNTALGQSAIQFSPTPSPA